MLHESLGFEVQILDGLNGKALPDYDSEGSKTKVSIEVNTGTIIYPRITIHSDFNWYDAEGLYVTIYYASHTEQLHVWVPKPDASVLGNESSWSFQIPGKNVQVRVSETRLSNFLFAPYLAQIYQRSLETGYTNFYDY